MNLDCLNFAIFQILFPNSISDKMMERFVAVWSIMLNTDLKRNLKWKNIVNHYYHY